MESVPDRPYATLTAVQLETRIAGNLSQQQALEKLRTRAAKYQLTQLRKTMTDLIAERNARGDFENDFPIPQIDTDSTSLRDVSSGGETVAQPLVGVGSVGNSTTRIA